MTTRRSLALALFLLCGVLFPGLGLAQGVSPKVSPDLVSLYQERLMPRPSQAAAPAEAEPLATSAGTLTVAQDWVTIDAAASGDPGALLGDLAAIGLVGGASHGRMVSGLLPISAISALENLGSLQFVRPAYFTTRAGLVTSQGDQAQRSDLARTTSGFDGTGVTVGVLSDSFNCVLTGATTAATDVANGDLSPVNVVQESPSCTGQTDEGRAMLQIVHDVAPGAGLAFATANGGQANFANNITALRTVAGADVIVDDVIYFAEPMFQDGVIAQAVDAAVAAGVPYFSAAGNEARQAYESPFRAGGVFAAGGSFGASFLGGTAHNFDAGGGTDVFQSLTFPGSGTYHMTLQWDSPFFSVSGAPGTRNDLNIYFLNSTSTAVLVAVNTDNTAGGAGGDAVEVVTLTVTGTPTVNLMIVNRTGTNPGRLKYVFDRPVTINEYATNSGTIYGHGNAAGAEAVGAAFYANTPAFGVNPPVLESYSSAGTTPILFTTTGTPIFDARASKPEIVAPDGANTTFFGSDITTDADTFPNFFGTSAAAPHAAAVAALMLQARPGLSPAEAYSALESTALDMGTPGFDNDSGSGLIRADAALASLPTPTVALSLSGSPMAEAGGTATVTATLSRPTGLAVSVTPAFGGTASFPADYTRSGSVITIPAGSLTGAITLTAVQDAIYEGDETIVVAIAGATNATPSGGSVTATITDDDPAPPGAATLVAPSGSIATTTPTYTWNAVTGATQYLLWVDDASGGRIR
ncbi:MAG TPA: S8 family serine peptidase, partial [Candidatus Binatia bacterium]|nr:S8 family serine peptidase [Candidatus Binatia bacterium]